MDDRVRGLRVRLLGGLVVEGIDQHALGSRKARLVLKRLAIARGRSVASDELIEVLWPGERPSRPSDQLGVLVSRLRRVIGADLLPHRDPGYALVVGWLDVDELAARVDEAAAARAEFRLAAARAAGEAAISLARGGLLPDDEGTWLDGERAWCAATIARAHHIVAEAALDAGDPDAAAATAEAALAGDPYDETALRILMRAHAAAGRPAAGLVAYVRVRDRLAEDLGVVPTHETEALHDLLVLGEVPWASVARPPEAPSVTLVGRQRELDALDAALERTLSGQPAAVVIRGEAGIGKTALVDRWRSALSGRATVVHCRCDPLGRDLPLQPLVDGIARHLATLGPAASAAALGDQASVLGGLLGTDPGGMDATVAADPELGRARLFAALLAVVERLAHGPLVVVIEDVHDAGPSTVGWISFALRRGRRLLLVCTTRRGGPDLPGADVLALEPLDRAAAAELVGEATVDDLLARSGGNPLFLLALAGNAGGELPATIRQAVDRQAESLGAATTTVRAAAIVGSAIDLDVLADVLARPAVEVLADLERACEVGLLVEAAEGFAFRHELVRQALESGAGIARRALVHRDVARVLRNRSPVDLLGVAVHARLGGETATAVEAYVAAAATAFARHDVQAALDHLRSAIELGPTPAAHALRARVRMATLDLAGAELDAADAVALGGGAQALEISAWVAYYLRRYDQARAFADAGTEQATSPALGVSCRAVGARVRHGAGDLAGASQWLEAAGEAPPEVRGVADVWLAQVRVHQGRPQEALATLERALTDPDRLAHPWAGLHGRFTRIMALGQLGRVGEALRVCDDLDEARLRSGVVGARFDGIAANARGWLLRNVGSIDLADDCNEQALAANSGSKVAAVGLTEAYWVALLDLADGRLLAGDPEGAGRRLAQLTGLDSWTGTMAWHQRQRLGLLRARLALAQGDPDAAGEQAAAVRADAAGRGARRYELLAAAIAALAERRPDVDAVGAVVAGLDECASLEGWRLTIALGEHVDVDRWRRDAERRAARVVAAAGVHAEQAGRWVDRLLSRNSAM